jgi:hypothetical protein
MDDFLRSMRGDAGPRIARGAIKRLRAWKFGLVLGWIALCFLVFWLVGRDAVRANVWPMVAFLVPLLPLIVAAGCCETQIRHFNGLALSPFETGRMNLAGARRMWIGNALMTIALGLFFAGPAFLSGNGNAYIDICVGAGLAMLVTGYVLSAYKTGLGWFSPRGGPYYDPDEDEWSWFGGWPR